MSDVTVNSDAARSVARKLVIAEGGEWTDRTLATASWWDRYLVPAGEYDVRYITSNFAPWKPGMRYDPVPYYADATFNAILVESYRESRLFSEVRPDRRTGLSEPTTRTVSMYGYECKHGATVLGGLGVIRDRAVVAELAPLGVEMLLPVDGDPDVVVTLTEVARYRDGYDPDREMVRWTAEEVGVVGEFPLGTHVPMRYADEED